MDKKAKAIAVPGFEPGLPDSESGVLTTTLHSSVALADATCRVNDANCSDLTLYNCLRGGHMHPDMVFLLVYFEAETNQIVRV